MFFTRIGKIVAHIMFWPSLIRVIAAVAIASGANSDEQRAAFVRRYLGSGTTGEIIDRALIYVFAALVLGIICEISVKIMQTEKL